MRAGRYPVLDDDLKTRQGRERIAGFIAGKIAAATCHDLRETLLQMVIAAVDPTTKISLDIETPDTFGDAIRAQVTETIGGALYLSALVWSHMDGHKPKWLEPYVAIQRTQILTDRARRMINRMQKGVRRGVISDAFTVEIVEAMGRIPRT